MTQTRIQIDKPTLGAFLRDRRQRAGLSRAEVAVYAGTSESWLTKIEQGHGGGVSADVLRALASALQLDGPDYYHAFDLARLAPPEKRPRPATTSAAEERAQLRPEHYLAADALVPHLAGHVNNRWDVLHANPEYARIFRHITQAKNVLMWFFFVPESRDVMVEWEREAELTVSWFRAYWAKNPDNTAFQALADQLAESPEFLAMWGKNDVAMSRHQPEMRVRDLDNGDQFNMITEVHSWPDPDYPIGFYLGIRV